MNLINYDNLEGCTFVMIKPDVIKINAMGAVISMIETSGFEVVTMAKIRLTKKEAEQFYVEHVMKSHFPELVEFMTSGDVAPMIIRRTGNPPWEAIRDARTLIGATNPDEQEVWTIRHQYASSIGQNAIHGSDSPASFLREVKQFDAWMNNEKRCR